MGLDVWFKEDVARILLCAHETMVSTLAATQRFDHGQEDFQRGFNTAIRAVAKAFGIPGSGIVDNAHNRPLMHVSNTQNPQINEDTQGYVGQYRLSSSRS